MSATLPTDYQPAPVGGALTTTWVTTPPIYRVILPADVARLANRLEEIINAYAGAAASAPRGQASDAKERAIVIGGRAGETDLEFYAYVYSGYPVGMMAVGKTETAKRGAVYIEELVGHPGAKNAGDLLVEYAVNLSEAAGTNGVVELTSLPGSSRFYANLGFVPKVGTQWVGLTQCRLKPAAPQWTKPGPQWRLNYIMAMKDGVQVQVDTTTQKFRA